MKLTNKADPCWFCTWLMSHQQARLLAPLHRSTCKVTVNNTICCLATLLHHMNEGTMSTIELQQVPTSLLVDAMLLYPSMNDTPSYSVQNAVLPHPVHFFPVLTFHFRKQIIIWRMYGVIVEVFDHSLDVLDTCKPFAFPHTRQCLLSTDSLRHLAIRFLTVDIDYAEWLHNSLA